jgi:hypothetical protein
MLASLIARKEWEKIYATPPGTSKVKDKTNKTAKFVNIITDE